MAAETRVSMVALQSAIESERAPVRSSAEELHVNCKSDRDQLNLASAVYRSLGILASKRGQKQLTNDKPTIKERKGSRVPEMQEELPTLHESVEQSDANASSVSRELAIKSDEMPEHPPTAPAAIDQSDVNVRPILSGLAIKADDMPEHSPMPPAAVDQSDVNVRKVLNGLAIKAEDMPEQPSTPPVAVDQSDADAHPMSPELPIKADGMSEQPSAPPAAVDQSDSDVRPMSRVRRLRALFDQKDDDERKKASCFDRCHYGKRPRQ